MVSRYFMFDDIIRSKFCFRPLMHDSPLYYFTDIGRM